MAAKHDCKHTDKLEKVASLIEQMTNPIEAMLKEIKASNRSRWIMMLAMISIVAMVAIGSFWVVEQLGDLSDQVAQIQQAQIVDSGRLTLLVDEAEATASTPKIREKLQQIQQMGTHSPENLVRAVAVLSPEIVLEAARSLESSTDKGEQNE